jgi:thioredoxin reductase
MPQIKVLIFQKFNKGKMKIEKKLGIWMDHSIAHIIEFTDQWNELKTIQSNFTHLDKVESLIKSEALMHNKEQKLQADFYKKLEDTILKYDDILLFGATNAKTELFNKMQKDHRFANVKITVKEADKMTNTQKIFFISDYFETVKT